MRCSCHSTLMAAGQAPEMPEPENFAAAAGTKGISAMAVAAAPVPCPNPGKGQFPYPAQAPCQAPNPCPSLQYHLFSSRMPACSRKPSIHLFRQTYWNIYIKILD